MKLIDNPSAQSLRVTKSESATEGVPPAPAVTPAPPAAAAVVPPPVQVGMALPVVVWFQLAVLVKLALTCFLFTYNRQMSQERQAGFIGNILFCLFELMP